MEWSDLALRLIRFLGALTSAVAGIAALLTDGAFTKREHPVEKGFWKNSPLPNYKVLDIFASCGAQSFVVNKLELEWPDHKKNIWGKHYSLDALREKLPGIVRTAAIRRPYRLPDGQEVMAGENVIIRPTGPGIALVQLDDLKTPEQLERVRPAAFIIHATSPGNYQAWVAVSGVPEDKEAFKTLMRRVRKAVGVNANDKSASHATRLAGTENFKTEYGPDFPMVSIVEAHPGRVMTPAQLEFLGLLAAPEPEQSSSVVELHPRRVSHSSGRERHWPDYQRCLSDQLAKRGVLDRSAADYFWCKMAAQGRWTVEETANKLLEVGEKAQERARCGDEGYALVTARNAAADAARGKQRGRG
jgi:hypothetical protein